MLRTTFSLALVIASTGCATNQGLKEKLLTRARFDLKCQELDATSLANNSLGYTTTWGVSGCGKQATYVATDSGWVLNGGTQEEESAKPQPKE